jgi:hypothetical protein
LGHNLREGGRGGKKGLKLININILLDELWITWIFKKFKNVDILTLNCENILS